MQIADKALRRVDDEARAGTCAAIIFGGSGDLTRRKILPALFHAYCEDHLPPQMTIVGVGIPVLTTEQYRDVVRESLNQFAGAAQRSRDQLNAFVAGCYYVGGSFDDTQVYQSLDRLLKDNAGARGCKDNRLYYLSTPPSVFGMICRQLADHGMSRVEDRHHWRRLIIEKPFGRDLASAQKLNQDIATAFEEWQIYRIDHYLGKETVQNIMAFRFANGIFEPLWNRNYIDHVQITVAESLGVEKRGGYYEESGALRDMIQNHVLQLVALVAMEPPATFDANAVRDEKVKVLRAVRPITREQVDDFWVRGQYDAGVVQNEMIAGYRSELNVKPDSSTETFVAGKVLIDNWRWAGVPFYIRTGKRMPRRDSEIAIFFKRTPHLMFSRAIAEKVEPNVLVLQIQPDEGILMKFEAKIPGPEMLLKAVDMHFKYTESFEAEIAEAYERLILDCLRGDATLFMRKDMVELAWWLVQPVVDHWSQMPAPFPNYPAGTWGPAAADALLAKTGHAWRMHG